MTAKEFKKIYRSQNLLLNDGRKFKFQYFFYGIVILLSALFTFICIMNNSGKEFDKGLMLMQSWQIIWCSAFLSQTMGIGIMTQDNNVQVAGIKGCLNANEIYKQFPVTKKQCVKFSYIMTTIMSIFPTIALIIPNVLHIFKPYLQGYAGEIGAINLIFVFYNILCMYAIYFCGNKPRKFQKAMQGVYLTIMFVLIVLLMFLSNISVISNFISKFDFLTGILGIVLLIAMFFINYAIGYFTVFRKKAQEAWSYE